MAAREGEADGSKATGGGDVTLYVRLPKALHRRLKVLSVKLGRPMYELHAEGMEAWVTKHEK